MMTLLKSRFSAFLKKTDTPVFFHISTDVNKDGVFIPRIPSVKAGGENETINRICVSTTIEGCLMAIPDRDMSWFNFQCHTMGYIKVFVIIPSELGIPDSAIMSDKELKEKEFVPDAHVTNEHWILESIEVPAHRQFIICFDSIEEGENHFPILSICDPILEEEKRLQFGCIDVDRMTEKIKECCPNAKDFYYSGHDVTGMYVTFPKGSNLSEIFHFHRTEGYPPIDLCDYKW